MLSSRTSSSRTRTSANGITSMWFRVSGLGLLGYPGGRGVSRHPHPPRAASPPPRSAPSLRAAAELEQQQVDPGPLELLDAPRDLLGRPHQAGLEPAVRDRVVLQADALLELRVGDPFLIVRVARRALAHVGDARYFALGGGLGGPADDIARPPELQGRELQPLAPRPQVGHLHADPLGG